MRSCILSNCRETVFQPVDWKKCQRHNHSYKPVKFLVQTSSLSSRWLDKGGGSNLLSPYISEILMMINWTLLITDVKTMTHLGSGHSEMLKALSWELLDPHLHLMEQNLFISTDSLLIFFVCSVGNITLHCEIFFKSRGRSRLYPDISSSSSSSFSSSHL